MANFNYNAGIFHLVDDTLYKNADIRALLLETDAENRDHASIQDIFDDGGVELSSTNYAREEIAGEVVNKDDVNDTIEFDGDDTVFDGSDGTGITQAGSEQAVAAVVYIHIDGTDANDIPLAHIDDGGFPITPNGSDITLQWNSDGIFLLDTNPS